MSFFGNEKLSCRTAFRQSRVSYDNNEVLQRELTIDGPSGFHISPYEQFRQNVANYCERYMLDSFDQTDCMTTGEKASFAYRNCCSKKFKRGSDDGECTSNSSAAQNVSRMSEVMNTKSNEDPSSVTSSTNPFSVLSMTFQPAETDESNEKSSFLKKISNLMHNYNSSKMYFTQNTELRENSSPHQFSRCECSVHIGKHGNCCQCQELYHKTNCDCVQHGCSHSYCCRCDVHLFQQFDQYLKKKKYLRLDAPQDDLPTPNSLGSLNKNYPNRPSTSQSRKNSCYEDRQSLTENVFGETVRFPRQVIRESPKENNHYQSTNAGSVFHEKKESDLMQNDSVQSHPCELCSKKVDDVYGSALREVHSMLVDLSRSLALTTNYCTVDSLINDTNAPQHSPEETDESQASGMSNDSSDKSAKIPQTLNSQTDVAIQVNIPLQKPNKKPRGIHLTDSLKKKVCKNEKMKKICVIS